MKIQRFPAMLLATLLGSACMNNAVKVTDAPPSWRAIALSDSRAVADEARPDPYIAALARDSALKAVEELGGGVVSPAETWMTVIDCRDPRDPRLGFYQGGERVYPASVVKLCYMVTAYDQNRTHGLALDEEMRADLRDMIVDSNNKATNRVLDRVSNTAFGPELAPPARLSFEMKRQTVSRYLESLGLNGLWAANKTFDDDIPLYGRDVQFLGERAGDNFEKSNMLTTDDTARLLYLIWRRAVVDHEACEEMLALMKREGESRTFFTKMVPEGWTLYSKDGYTGQTRHEAGIFERPDGTAVIIVVFTKQRNLTGESPQVIERAATLALEAMARDSGQWDNASADYPEDQKRQPAVKE